jgi:hypothetical protein
MPQIFELRSRSLSILMDYAARRFLFTLAVLVAIAPGLYRSYAIFTASRLVQGEQTLDRHSRAIELDPGDSSLWWSRGQLRHYSLGAIDLKTAIRDYEQALTLNPRLGQAWLDVADCYERTGAFEKAEHALNQAMQVWTYSSLTRWQAGNFYLSHGNLDKMYKCFKMAGEHDSEKLGMAIRLAWKADPNHAEIGQKLIPNKLPARLLYLDFLVARDELDLAFSAWMDSLVAGSAAEFQINLSSPFSLIDRLLAHHRVSQALIVWEETLQKAGLSDGNHRFVRKGDEIQPAAASMNLIWNGSFESKLQNAGFDWRYPGTTEVVRQSDSTDSVDGRSSLKMTFGNANLDCACLTQIVPILTPGSYLLEFYIKTANLNTDQRPYVLIQGYPEVRADLARTEIFPESTPWRKYVMPFKVAPGMNAVQIVLRRRPSEKFDNRLKGSLWIDKASMRVQVRQ